MTAKKLSKTTKLCLGFSAGALVLGVGMGATVAPPAPAPITITKTVTKEVVKPVIPFTCMSALTSADTVNLETMQVFDLFSQSATAIATGQYAASNLILKNVSKLSVQILAHREAYKTAAADCRTEGGQQ